MLVTQGSHYIYGVCHAYDSRFTLYLQCLPCLWLKVHITFTGFAWCYPFTSVCSSVCTNVSVV